MGIGEGHQAGLVNSDPLVTLAARRVFIDAFELEAHVFKLLGATYVACVTKQFALTVS